MLCRPKGHFFNIVLYHIINNNHLITKVLIFNFAWRTFFWLWNTNQLTRFACTKHRFRILIVFRIADASIGWTTVSRVENPLIGILGPWLTFFALVLIICRAVSNFCSVVSVSINSNPSSKPFILNFYMFKIKRNKQFF